MGRAYRFGQNQCLLEAMPSKRGWELLLIRSPRLAQLSLRRPGSGIVKAVVRKFAGEPCKGYRAQEFGLWESRPDVGLKRAGSVPPRLEERPSTRQRDRRRSNVRPLSPGVGARSPASRDRAGRRSRDACLEVGGPGHVKSALITTVGEQALRPEGRQDRSTNGEQG